MLKHWTVRALGQKLLWRLPGGVRLNTLVSLATAGHNLETDLFDRQVPRLARHLNAAQRHGLNDLSSTTALEIGTGWDLNVALLLKNAGCRQVYTADVFRHVRLAQVHRARTLLEEAATRLDRDTNGFIRHHALDWNRLTGTIGAICCLAGVEYLAPVSPDYREITDHSVDLCCSTAVLEHIRPHAVAELLRCLHGKLSPDGLLSHIIDLKDHFAYFQPGLPYNNFLRFSEREWEWWAGNPMTYTNRLSRSAWRRLFEATGYDIVMFEEVPFRDLPTLPAGRIHPSNRHWTEQDLRTSELHVVARRRR